MKQVIDGYTDVAGVAEFLGIHPESVRRLCRQGKLKSIRVGNKNLFSVAYIGSVDYDPTPGPKKRGELAEPGKATVLKTDDA